MNTDIILIERQLFPASSRIFVNSAMGTWAAIRSSQLRMVASAAGLALTSENGVLCYADIPWEPEFNVPQCLDLILAAGIRVDHARVICESKDSPTRRGTITARYEVASNIMLTYSETYTGAARRLFTFKAVSWTLATMLGAWYEMNDEDRNWLYAQGDMLRSERAAKAAEALVEHETEGASVINTYDRQQQKTNHKGA